MREAIAAKVTKPVDANKPATKKVDPNVGHTTQDTGSVADTNPTLAPSRAVKADIAKKQDRELAPRPKVVHPYTTRPYAMHEDGGAGGGAVGIGAPTSIMAIGNGDPGHTTNASDNYSMQKYRASVKSKMQRRKKPVL